MNTSDEPRGDVILPGTATDFLKAIRELFGLVKEMVNGGKWVVDIYRNDKKKEAASNLNRLRFTKSGSKPYLERIIAGNSSPEDIEAIGRLMADSAAEVETSIAGLEKYSDVVRETYGMAVVERLERMIGGPTGKRMIRYSLMNLVKAAGQPNADSKMIQDSAKETLRWIEQLNVEFCELHDLILEIEGKSTSVAKKTSVAKNSSAKKKR